MLRSLRFDIFQAIPSDAWDHFYRQFVSNLQISNPTFIIDTHISPPALIFRKNIPVLTPEKTAPTV